MKHPSQIQLVHFAQGLSDVTDRILMEAHQHFCSECENEIKSLRQSVANFESGPGYQNLLQPVLVFEKLKSRLTNQLSESQSLKSQPKGSPLGFPEAVRSELPDESKWKWQSFWPTKGRYALVINDLGSGTKLYCLEYKPRAKAPSHSHQDQEDTVIIKGGYTSGGKHFGEGDWDMQLPITSHPPILIEETGCLCLVRSISPPRFRGLSAWRQLGGINFSLLG